MIKLTKMTIIAEPVAEEDQEAVELEMLLLPQLKTVKNCAIISGCTQKLEYKLKIWIFGSPVCRKHPSQD